MKQSRKNILSSLALSIAVLSSGPAYASDDDESYEVTITNLTRGQSFTPIMIATQKRHAGIYALGQPASAELATIAESGNPSPISEVLAASSNTIEVKNSGALLAPGASVTMTINGEDAKYFSMASMLIPTNDAFVALNSIRLPKGKRAGRYVAIAYDAGSEPNDELCVNIPGPVCKGTGPSPEASGEGYVHVHAGIHGSGDDVTSLNASERDFRNPAALVKIRRLR